MSAKVINTYRVGAVEIYWTASSYSHSTCSVASLLWDMSRDGCPGKDIPLSHFSCSNVLNFQLRF